MFKLGQTNREFLKDIFRGFRKQGVIGILKLETGDLW